MRPHGLEQDRADGSDGCVLTAPYAGHHASGDELNPRLRFYVAAGGDYQIGERLVRRRVPLRKLWKELRRVRPVGERAALDESAVKRWQHLFSQQGPAETGGQQIRGRQAGPVTAGGLDQSGAQYFSQPGRQIAAASEVSARDREHYASVFGDHHHRGVASLVRQMRSRRPDRYTEG